MTERSLETLRDARDAAESLCAEIHYMLQNSEAIAAAQQWLESNGRKVNQDGTAFDYDARDERAAALNAAEALEKVAVQIGTLSRAAQRILRGEQVEVPEPAWVEGAVCWLPDVCWIHPLQAQVSV